MAVDDLYSTCLQLVEIAIEAGKLIVAGRSTSVSFVAKKNSTDIVTETDAAVENFVQHRLHNLYPSFAFVGEESYKGNTRISDEPTFIVDPIDGTSNFVHGLPDVCVSIALVIKKQPAVGVVYNPFHSELWYAASGHGAFYRSHDGVCQRLLQTLPPLAGLASACVGIEWGSDREGPNFEMNLAIFSKLARKQNAGGSFVNCLRATGSAAITMCRVAAGQQDCFWECGSWAWDVAAAWCIVVEAGGLVVDVHPHGWNPPLDNRRYLVVRPSVSGQHQMIEEFWSVVGDSRSTFGP